MGKEEYLKLSEFVNIDDLKEKENKDQNNMKDKNSIRKTLKELINFDSEKIYPSYYQRTVLHKGVLKTYSGFYNKLENGFLIFNMSNAFLLYDKSILTKEIENMLEKSASKHDSMDIQNKSEIVLDIFNNQIEKEISKPVISTTNEGNFVKIKSLDIFFPVLVPTKYYVIAKKLLGKDTKEYIYDMGLFLESSSGKALLMKKKF